MNDTDRIEVEIHLEDTPSMRRAAEEFDTYSLMLFRALPKGGLPQQRKLWDFLDSIELGTTYRLVLEKLPTADETEREGFNLA